MHLTVCLVLLCLIHFSFPARVEGLFCKPKHHEIAFFLNIISISISSSCRGIRLSYFSYKALPVQLLVYRKADLDGSPSLVTLANKGKSEKHSVVVSSLSASYKRTCEIGQLA